MIKKHIYIYGELKLIVQLQLYNVVGISFALNIGIQFCVCKTIWHTQIISNLPKHTCRLVTLHCVYDAFLERAKSISDFCNEYSPFNSDIMNVNIIYLYFSFIKIIFIYLYYYFFLLASSLYYFSVFFCFDFTTLYDDI